MKVIRLKDAIDQGKYILAAHLIVFGIVKVQTKEVPARGKSRTAGRKQK